MIMGSEWPWRVGLALVSPVVVLACVVVIVVACIILAVYAPFYFIFHREALKFDSPANGL